jgi:hypothetical protein
MTITERRDIGVAVRRRVVARSRHRRRGLHDVGIGLPLTGVTKPMSSLLQLDALLSHSPSGSSSLR